MLLLVTSAAWLQAQKQSVSAGRIAGATVAGFIAVPVGFAVGYTIGSGFRPHGSSNSGVALGFAGALLGPAAAVSAVGSGGPSRGNFGAAVGGAAIGYAAAYFVVPVAAKVNPPYRHPSGRTVAPPTRADGTDRRLVTQS